MIIEPQYIHNTQILKYIANLIRKIYYNATLDVFTLISSALNYGDIVLLDKNLIITVKEKYDNNYIKKLNHFDIIKIINTFIHLIGKLNSGVYGNNLLNQQVLYNFSDLINYNNGLLGGLPFVLKQIEPIINTIKPTNVILTLLGYDIGEWKNIITTYEFKNKAISLKGIEPTPKYLQLIEDKDSTMKDIMKALILSNHDILSKNSKSNHSVIPKNSKNSNNNNKKALFRKMGILFNKRNIKYSKGYWKIGKKAACLDYHIGNGCIRGSGCNFTHKCICGELHPFISCKKYISVK